MDGAYGLLEPLYEAIGMHAPEIEVTCHYRSAAIPLLDADSPEEAGLRLFMRVGYGDQELRRIVWDAGVEAYRYGPGPGDGEVLGADPAEAARRITAALGAPVAGEAPSATAPPAAVWRKSSHSRP